MTDIWCSLRVCAGISPPKTSERGLFQGTETGEAWAEMSCSLLNVRLLPL